MNFKKEIDGITKLAMLELDKLKVYGWIYLLTAIASNPFVIKAAKEPDMNPAISSSIPRSPNYGTYFFILLWK